MDITGVSSPPVGVNENNPRQRYAADSLPSLSQLRLLYEEAVQEETAPPPVQENNVKAPESVGPALRADIPSLEQMTALRDETKQTQERRRAEEANERSSYGRTAERPVRRGSPVSAAAPAKKPAARRIRALTVAEKKETAGRERPFRREEGQPASSADIPTLTQLSSLREEAATAGRESNREVRREPQQKPQRELQRVIKREVPRKQHDVQRDLQWEPQREVQSVYQREPQAEYRREPQREYQREAERSYFREPQRNDQREPQTAYQREPENAWEESFDSRPSREFTAADIPSLTALRQMRETADREQRAFSEPSARHEVHEQMRSRGPEPRANRLPTVEQLRAQLEEETQYDPRDRRSSAPQTEPVYENPSYASRATWNAGPQTADTPRRSTVEQRTGSARNTRYRPYEDDRRTNDFSDFDEPDDSLAADRNSDVFPARRGERNLVGFDETERYRTDRTAAPPQRMRGEERDARWEPRQEPQRANRWDSQEEPRRDSQRANRWNSQEEPRRDPQRANRWDSQEEPRRDPQRANRWDSQEEPRRDPQRANRWEPQEEPRRDPQRANRWEPQEEPRRVQERDYDEPYVSRPSRNLTSADIPSLAALRQMREDTGREPDDFRAPPARENEPDAAAKRRSQERREDRFPTVEQLRAQREEEQRYGNRAFQESVRQIKHAPNDPAQDAGAQREAARQKAPEPQRGEADRRADAPPKVHYIPYEDFLKNESFEDLTPAGKNGEAGPARVAGKNPQKNDAAEGNAYRRPPQRARRDPYADGARPNGYPDWADGRPYPAPGAPEAADYPQERPKGKIAGKVKKNARKKKTTDSGDSFLGQLPTADQLKKSKPKFGHRKAAVTGEMPSDKQLTKERSRLRYKSDFLRVLRNTLFTLITVSAIAVLIAVLLLPVLRIYGTSMTPTLDEGNIVISVKGGKFDTGDVVAFYYNNKILVKRVIAQAGDWVDIAKDGTVSVNGVVLDEPYVQSKAFGECDIELPYQVPEDRVFVMGDYRDVSIDSRNTSIGPIAKEQIVGRIVYRIWPFDSFGSFE